MPLNTKSAIELLPQKGPAVVVDDLISTDSNETKTSFLVKEDCLYLEKNVLSEGGLIENIAQTFLLGLSTGQQETSNEFVFLLSGIQQCELTRSPQVNEFIHTTATLTKEALGMFKVDGKIYLEEELIFDATLIVTKIKNDRINT